jgi:hypothetical protein
MADNANPTPIHPIGIYPGVYYLSVHILMKNTNIIRLHRSFYTSFSSVLLLLNTMYFIQWPYIGQMAWINTWDTYPNDPLQYYSTSYNDPVIVLSSMAQIITVILNNSLLESSLSPNYPRLRVPKFYLSSETGISLLCCFWSETLYCHTTSFMHPWNFM